MQVIQGLNNLTTLLQLQAQCESDEHFGMYVITPSLEFKKNGPDVKEATQTTLIHAIAQRILDIAGTYGKDLFDACESPLYAERVTACASTLIGYLIHMRNRISIIGVTYDDTALTLALSYLKKCGQASQLIAVEAAAKNYFNVAIGNHTSDTIGVCHLEFHTLYLQLLSSMTPVVQQILLEKEALQAAESSFIDVQYMYKPLSKCKREEFIPLELSSAVYQHNNAREILSFHGDLKRACRKWAAAHTPKNIASLISSIQKILQRHNAYQKSSPQREILRAQYLHTIAWAGRSQISCSTFQKIKHIAKQLLALTKGSCVIYHRTQGQRILMTQEMFYLIFTPFISPKSDLGLSEMLSGAVQISQLIAMKRGTCSGIHASSAFVRAIHRNQIQEARRAFYDIVLSFRREILQSVERTSLQHDLQKYSKEKIKKLYRLCYEKFKRQFQEKHVNDSLKLLPPGQFFSQVKQIQSDWLAPHPSVASFHRIFQLQAELLHQKREPLRSIPSCSKSYVQISSDKVDDLAQSFGTSVSMQEANIEGAHNLEKKQNLREAFQPATRKIIYASRVNRWFINGYRVVQDDPDYADLPADEQDEMIYRHAFPRAIDAYLDTLFTSFTWHTRHGRCILYTAPASLVFKGKRIEGFIEYTFSLWEPQNGTFECDRCFHRYFAQERNSLCHSLAEQGYLAMTRPAMDKEEEGIWEVSGSHIRIHETAGETAFIDEKACATITIKKPRSSTY